jgi:hypothetical protein
VGCGTGIVTAKIADLPAVAEAVGVDPARTSLPGPAGARPRSGSRLPTGGTCRSRTGPSTGWSSPPLCATSRRQSWPWPRRTGYSGPAARC